MVSIHGEANVCIKDSLFPLLLVTAVHKNLFYYLVNMGCMALAVEGLSLDSCITQTHEPF